MLVKTNILIRGCPVWIELEHKVLQPDLRFHKQVVEDILKTLIRGQADEMERMP